MVLEFEGLHRGKEETAAGFYTCTAHRRTLPAYHAPLQHLPSPLPSPATLPPSPSHHLASSDPSSIQEIVLHVREERRRKEKRSSPPSPDGEQCWAGHHALGGSAYLTINIQSVDTCRPRKRRPTCHLGWPLFHLTCTHARRREEEGSAVKRGKRAHFFLCFFSLSL